MSVNLCTLEIKSVADLPRIRDCIGIEFKWAIPQVAPEGSIIGITSEPGAGKNTLCLAFAKTAILEGRPVLFLDRENPVGVVFEYVTRLDIPDGQGFHYWGGWQPDPPPGSNSSIIEAFIREAPRPPIIVVDSYTAYLDGDDEKEAKVSRLFFSGWRRHAHLGATIVVLHHVGKGATSRKYRGSTDFAASIDAGFTLKNTPPGGKLSKLTLTPFKSRFGQFTPITFNYLNGKITMAKPPVSHEHKLNAILRAYAGVNTKEFEGLASSIAHIGRNQARAFLDEGVKSGGIELTRGNNNAARYRLIEEDDSQ